MQKRTTPFILLPFIFLLSACTSAPQLSSSTPESGSSTQQAVSQNQKECEQIISTERISQFAGYQYTFQEDPVPVEGNFSCMYTTTQGPGSRTIVFRKLDDPEKIAFTAAQSAGDTKTDAPEYGEAYYNTSIIKQTEADTNTTPELSLHVHKNGTTYTVNVVQYKPDTESKAFIKEILDKLLAS